MSSRSNPSTGKGGKAPATAPQGVKKPVIKSTTGKPQPLLPPRTRTGATSSVTSDPMRPKNISSLSALSAAKKVEQERRRKMMNQYDQYLINLVQQCCMEDLEVLQEMEHCENTVESAFGVCSDLVHIVESYADQVVIKIFKDLQKLAVLDGAFKNLVDFAGEEALVQIQTLLIKKFEKVRVESLKVDRPIFKDSELLPVLDLTRSHLQKQLKDEFTVAGLVKSFNQVLSDLVYVTEGTLKKNKKLQRQNRIALEFASLSICNRAWDAYEMASGSQEPQNGEDVRPEED